MPKPTARAILDGPDVYGHDPEGPAVVDAVCDWHDAVQRADEASALDELVAMRYLVGADEAVRWASQR
jgi:hypothetical protein